MKSDKFQIKFIKKVKSQKELGKIINIFIPTTKSSSIDFERSTDADFLVET